MAGRPASEPGESAAIRGGRREGASLRPLSCARWPIGRPVAAQIASRQPRPPHNGHRPAPRNHFRRRRRRRQLAGAPGRWREIARSLGANRARGPIACPVVVHKRAAGRASKRAGAKLAARPPVDEQKGRASKSGSKTRTGRRLEAAPLSMASFVRRKSVSFVTSCGRQRQRWRRWPPPPPPQVIGSKVEADDWRNARCRPDLGWRVLAVGLTPAVPSCRPPRNSILGRDLGRD